MRQHHLRLLAGLCLAAGFVQAAIGTEPAAKEVKAAAAATLADYRTVDTAITSLAGKVAATTARQPSYLGIVVAPNGDGKLAIAEVALDSPASRAGLKKGDLIAKVAGRETTSADMFREILVSKAPGEALPLSVVRNSKPLEVAAKLSAVSRPVKLGEKRAVLGIDVGEAKGSEGVPILRVAAGSPAAKANLKVGETILKFDGVPVTGPNTLSEILAAKKPGDPATLTLLLAEKAVDFKMPLGEEAAASEGRGGGWNARGGGGIGGGYWRKDVYRLGVICVEYPDVKHNTKITPQAWHESMFSRGTYNKTCVTGQPVYGSMADYYWEQSYHTLKVEGKVFDYVTVSKKRNEYATGNRTALLTEAMQKVVDRDKDAFKDLDGVFFVYAGGRVPPSIGPRGSLYWPHRSSVSFKDKRWPYFICPEGGERMANISVFCHEFGHMLGLPDLYARPENPGSEGLDIWCAMSNQAGQGRPQHFSAWPKERLGWIKPTVIDPTVKQKLLLGAIEDSPKECFKIFLRPDGSEYLLLENRRKKGFDQSLPGEGLLIWRVVGSRPILEESHGIEGPAGPRSFRNLVPFPTSANDSFTPFTVPSSRSQLGGGLPVHITNIRQLPDGRIAFHIGYEYE